MKFNPQQTIVICTVFVVAGVLVFIYAGVKPSPEKPLIPNAPAPQGSPVKPAPTPSTAVTAGTLAIPKWYPPAVPPDQEEQFAVLLKSPTANNFHAKLAFIHALPDDLSESDRFVLYRYLADGENGELGYAIKNDIISQLTGQKIVPSELPGKLIDIWQDGNADHVLRMYAFQHLRPLYDRLPNGDDKNQIFEAMRSASTMNSDEFAGMALLAMFELAKRHPEFSSAMISQNALKTASDSSASHASRITAMQVAADLRSPEILPVARQLIDSETPALALSAIAAIGSLGSAADLQLLREIEQKKQYPYDFAAKAAATKIFSNLNTN